MTIRTEEGEVEVSEHGLKADRTLKLGYDQGDKAGDGVLIDRIRSRKVWGIITIITTNSFNSRIFIEKVCKLVIQIFNREDFFIKQ